MKSVITHPTPQHVVDAIHVVAAWLREIESPEALISPQGGASFHADRQMERLFTEIEQIRAGIEAIRADYPEDVFPGDTGKGARLAIDRVLALFDGI